MTQVEKKLSARIMPNNYEAERALLGALLIDKEVSFDIMARLNADDFYFEAHKIIFDAMRDIYRSNRPIDFISVTDKLEKTLEGDGKTGKAVDKPEKKASNNNLIRAGGLQYISELSTLLPSAANYSYYCDIVTRDSLLRKLINGGNKIIQNAYTSENSLQALGLAEKIIFDISKEGETTSLLHVKESANDVIKKFEGIMADSGSNKGLLSGFYNLDNVTNGFLPAQMIVLAARPGCGKTSYAMNMVANIAVKTPHKKIAIFNLEMSSTELTQRLICNMAEVSMEKVLKGETSEEEFNRLWIAKSKLDESNIYIDDSAMTTPEEIMSKCRRLSQQKGGLDLIVIDYLQLLGSSRRSDSKQTEVSEISRSIKIMAKELKVPVLILSQMSRAIEKRDKNDKKPRLSDLRESGAIEQDADIVLFLDKDDSQDKNAPLQYIELIMGKHRNGPCVDMDYQWIGDCVKFIPVQKHQRYAKQNEEKIETIVTEPTGGVIAGKSSTVADEGFREDLSSTPLIATNQDIEVDFALPIDAASIPLESDLPFDLDEHIKEVKTSLKKKPIIDEE